MNMDYILGHYIYILSYICILGYYNNITIILDVIIIRTLWLRKRMSFVLRKLRVKHHGISNLLSNKPEKKYKIENEQQRWEKC